METRATMMTRHQYLAIGGQEAHRQYYSQFVSTGVKTDVLQRIGLNRLLKSSDPHFNDIPLMEWDRISTCTTSIDRALREAGDYPTLGGLVCIYKEAARQIVEGEISCDL